MTLKPGEDYEVPKRRGTLGVRGKVRVVKPGQRIRMTDAKACEGMREHGSGVLEGLAKE